MPGRLNLNTSKGAPKNLFEIEKDLEAEEVEDALAKAKVPSNLFKNSGSFSSIFVVFEGKVHLRLW